MEQRIRIEFKENKSFDPEYTKRLVSNAIRDAMNRNGMGEAKISDMFNIKIE
jgi:hypothetical protein